ncbi:MAG: hypothetical protein NVSMB31_07690 [Vulcanimicrobiaceae bacterium]
MRLATLVLLLLLSTATGAFASGDESVAPAAGSSATAPAPADEYFGHLKMSILGIRNQLVRLTRQVEQNPSEGDSTTGPASLTEESIKEWEQKYPSDPWLAKTVYMLVHMYAKIPSAAGHSSALRALGWLISKYPNSEFASQAMEEMKQTPSPGPG